MQHANAYWQLMRFDKPIGTVLLFWPVCWALLLAYGNHPPLSVVTVFTIGVILTRAAGCIINDLCDRQLDQHVSRTHARPLASGALSVKQALAMLGILVVGLVSLLFFLNPLNQCIALLAAMLTVFYPLSKRFFAYPQLVLGVTFNLGVVMVFVQAGALSNVTWWLYGASVAWTFAYDTVYALADKVDDARIGIHSSALSLGKQVQTVIALSYGAMGFCLVIALGQSFMVGSVVALLGAGAYASLHGIAARAPIAFFKGNAVLGGLVAVLVISLF